MDMNKDNQWGTVYGDGLETVLVGHHKRTAEVKCNKYYGTYTISRSSELGQYKLNHVY